MLALLSVCIYAPRLTANKKVGKKKISAPLFTPLATTQMNYTRIQTDFQIEKIAFFMNHIVFYVILKISCC